MEVDIFNTSISDWNRASNEDETVLFPSLSKLPDSRGFTGWVLWRDMLGCRLE